MSHTDSPVGFTHTDGYVICPECHKYLGMDQASECTAVFRQLWGILKDRGISDVPLHCCGCGEEIEL